MTLVPKNKDKRCLKACDKKTIGEGRCDCYNKSIKYEGVKEAAEHIYNNFKKPKTERVVKLRYYCKGVGGLISLETLSPVCDHPECSACRMIEESIKKLAGDFVFENICSNFEPRDDYSSGICKNCGIKFDEHGK